MAGAARAADDPLGALRKPVAQVLRLAADAVDPDRGFTGLGGAGIQVVSRAWTAGLLLRARDVPRRRERCRAR
ncbi:hypothetical protein ACFP50_18250, partial [Streptomyces pratens]